MAKGIYIGNSKIARKVKKIYIGVNGVARKVKKAYIGVKGVAKLFYNMVSQRGLSKVSPNPANLSIARKDLAGASVGDYALFAGGFTNDSVDTVDAYNTSLTKTTVSALANARDGLGGATVGNYALFAGGYTPFGRTATVESYNASLTRGTAPDLGLARNSITGAGSATHAMFGGGKSNNGASQGVDQYDSSLTHEFFDASMPGFLIKPASATVGDVLFFAGGETNDGKSSEMVIGFFSTAYFPSAMLTNPVRNLAGASVGEYALFAGGVMNNNALSDVVNVYNANLTKLTDLTLYDAESEFAGGNTTNYAIFAGGAFYGITDATVFDKSLTKTQVVTLDVKRKGVVAASLKDSVIFAGGVVKRDVNQASVDAYKEM